MSTSFAFRQPGKTQADWMGVPPVFIVGCPRSGTTLLRLMLTAHPNISISSEGAYVYTLWPEFAVCGDLSDPAKLRGWYQILQTPLEGEKLLSPPTFDEFLEWVTEFGASLRSIVTFYGTWEARMLGKKELAIPQRSRTRRDAIICRARRALRTLVTGGSDFHGAAKPDVELGTGRGGRLRIPEDLVERLRAACKPSFLKETPR